MSLKILGGQYKGLSLSIAKNFSDRPTSVILRRKIFDANQYMSPIVFVDLCAGTGMMGIEAISRGAKEIWFIEQNRRYVQDLKMRITDKKIVGNMHFINQDCLQYLKSLKQGEQSFHDWVFFLDPPYHKKELYDEAMKLIKSFRGKFQIWLEGSEQKNFSQKELEKKFGSFDKIYTHGTNYLAVYKSKEEDEESSLSRDI